MQILENFDLKNINTFHISERAAHFTTIKSEVEMLEIVKSNVVINQPLYIVGGGSNILLTKTIEGLVVLNQIKGIEVVDENEDEILAKFMSGENWHECVLWAVSKGYGGIENLSLIPGTIGAAPIQNIGAYGVEIKDVFVSCEAINIKSQEKKTFSKELCRFGYRDSIFKQEEKGNYFILSVTLRLKKNPTFNIDYGDIKKIIETEYQNEVTIEHISNAVIAIRSSKLPDPNIIGNAGSFFKNPVIEKELFLKLQNSYPTIPNFPAPNGIKIPAAWLIEQCQWKGYKEANFGVHDKQALVIVNYADAKGKDLFELSERIITSVQQRFNISLEREVNIW
jgi:UDP-N-acetylmuramate dehydrogenase